MSHCGHANDALRRLVASREMSAIAIDTRLDSNGTGLRTPAEVESVIARMDVILTTRLHGLVLALKNSVPAVVIDPVAGGAKIRRQTETIGWPLLFTADALDDDELARAFDHCLTAEARIQARECAARARSSLIGACDRFLPALGVDADSV